jgi:hypothetical protein
MGPGTIRFWLLTVIIIAPVVRILRADSPKVPTTPTASIRDPRGNEKVGLAVNTQISRKTFGITWNEAMESGGIAVADEVSISLDLELIKNTQLQ